jgi:hypothetical protein
MSIERNVVRDSVPRKPDLFTEDTFARLVATQLTSATPATVDICAHSVAISDGLGTAGST